MKSRASKFLIPALGIAGVLYWGVWGAAGSAGHGEFALRGNQEAATSAAPEEFELPLTPRIRSDRTERKTRELELPGALALEAETTYSMVLDTADLDELNGAEEWTARVRGQGSILPSARFELHRRSGGVELIVADREGRVSEFMSVADRLSLLVPASLGTELRRLPCRLEPEAPNGAGILVDLLSVIVVEFNEPRAAANSHELRLQLSELALGSQKPTPERASTGWPMGPDRHVFVVPGTAKDSELVPLPRVDLGIESGDKRLGVVQVPWPCWASNGSFALRPASVQDASLAVHLEVGAGTAVSDSSFQVTLHRPVPGERSQLIGSEFCSAAEPAVFHGLDLGEVLLYVNHPDRQLMQFKSELRSGENQVTIPVGEVPERLAFEVSMHFADGLVPEDLRVTARPLNLAVDKAKDLALVADAAQPGVARVEFQLAPGRWELSAYSPRNGASFGEHTEVSAADGRYRFEVASLGRLLPVRLADDLDPGRYEFWLDLNGRGLRLLTTGLPGETLTHLYEKESRGYWVLVHPSGVIHSGTLDELTFDSGEPARWILRRPAQWDAAPLLRVSRFVQGGLEATVLGQPTDRLGYLAGFPLPADTPEIRGEGRAWRVVDRRTQDWLTTLFVD